MELYVKESMGFLEKSITNFEETCKDGWPYTCRAYLQDLNYLSGMIRFAFEVGIINSKEFREYNSRIHCTKGKAKNDSSVGA